MKIIGFSDAMQQYRYTMKISPCCSTENAGIFVADCVDAATVPADWFVYYINTTGTGTWKSLVTSVPENCGGTFLTQTPVKMNAKGFHALALWGYSWRERIQT